MTQANRLTLPDVFGLFTVVLAVIYAPISVWMLKADGAGRFPLIFFALSTIALFPKVVRLLFSKPIVFYFLLCIFQFVNGMVKGSYLNSERDGVYLMATNIFLPLLSLIFVYNAATKNFDYTLKVCTYGLFIYSFICLFAGGLLSNVDRYSYDINANEIAMYCALSIGLFVLSYIRKVIHLRHLLLALIPFICVIITASRMGITMIAIMLLGYWYVKTIHNRQSLNTILSSFVLLMFLIWGAFYVMKHTEVGKRLSSTKEQITYVKTGTLFDYYGDRGFQYYDSWPLFLEHPMTGIGFSNWIRYNPRKQVCHSEYLVQYLEGGLVSFALYLLFWISMLKCLGKKDDAIENNLLKSTRTILLFLLMSIVFANTVLWSYNFYCIFMVYAFVLGFYKNTQIASSGISLPSGNG